MENYLDNLVSKLESLKEQLRGKHLDCYDYIAFGNNQFSVHTQRIRNAAYSQVLEELPKGKANDEQRSVRLQEILDQSTEYRRTIDRQVELAYNIQELLDNIEITKLKIKVKLTIINALAAGVRDV